MSKSLKVLTMQNDQRSKSQKQDQHVPKLSTNIQRKPQPNVLARDET